MLRAEIQEDGIREVAFHELGRPALPIAEQRIQPRHVVDVTEQQLARAGRRARAGVKQRDVHLAPREALIEHGQIADDEGEKAEAHARLHHGESAGERAIRGHVSDAEGEEGGAAHVEIGPEAARALGDVQVRAESPLRHGEAHHERHGPAGHEHEKGQGAVYGEKVLPSPSATDEIREGGPRGPGGAVEHPGRPKAPARRAGKNESFEGVPHHHEDHDDPRDGYQLWKHRGREPRSGGALERAGGSNRARPEHEHVAGGNVRQHHGPHVLELALPA